MSETKEWKMEDSSTTTFKIIKEKDNDGIEYFTIDVFDGSAWEGVKADFMKREDVIKLRDILNEALK